MSLASWLPVPLFHRAPRLNKASRLQPSRRPTRSRPLVERLEERTLLDGSGVLPGADTLASNFAPVSIGQGLPTSQNFPNTSSLTAESYPNAGGESALAATSSFMAQDLNGSQLRDFGVNSQGDNFLLSQTTVNILLDAYGFGSGTQPNAPWAPAAYNLGLANHQYGYPSQSDLGFSATPPWFHPTAQSLPKEQPLEADEFADLVPESPLLQQSTKERGQDQQLGMDENAQEKSENKSAPTEKAEEEQPVPEEVKLDLTRGDPAIEDALFSDPLHTLAGKENKVERATAEENSIPSPLWISALAPAQMAALVVGLPGATAPSDGGNMASAPEASE